MLDTARPGRPRSQRPRLSQEGARDPRLRAQRLSCSARRPSMPIDDRRPIRYPRIKDDEDAVIVAGINLDWMSKIMGNLGGRPGVSAVLIDSEGTVLAAPPDQASMIGRPLDTCRCSSAVARQGDRFGPARRIAFIHRADGSKRAVTFARIPGTASRLIVSIDEAKVAGEHQPRDPHRLSAAWPSSACSCCSARWSPRERLIIQPIEMMAAMAKRFGQGDWSARAAEQPAAGGIRAAGARLQRHGGAARRARARTGRHQ